MLNFVVSGIENEVTIDINKEFSIFYAIYLMWRCTDVHQFVIKNGFNKTYINCDIVMALTNHDEASDTLDVSIVEVPNAMQQMKLFALNIHYFEKSMDQTINIIPTL